MLQPYDSGRSIAEIRVLSRCIPFQTRYFAGLPVRYRACNIALLGFPAVPVGAAFLLLTGRVGMSEALMSTYSRLPVTFERGEGAWLWDSTGKKYLDALSGVAVCGLGHSHPAVAEAVCEQARRLVHTSNLSARDHRVRS